MARKLRMINPLAADLGAAINDVRSYVVASFRQIKADITTATGAGTTFTAAGFHDDASERTVTLANATDLPSAIALVEAEVAIYNFHRADTLAHKLADATNALVVTAPSIDLATAMARANDLKAKYNAHRVLVASHSGGADATNAVAAADATNLATLQTLANEIKADMNLHMASAPATKAIRVVPA